MNSNSFKIKALLGLAAILFLSAGILAGSNLTQTRQNITEYAAAATSLFFEPSSQNANPGNAKTMVLKMDTGPNNVTGLDILLKFDPSSLQVSSIQPGSGITSFENTITNSFDNTTGTVSYAAFTLDKRLAVNGSSIEVLKINTTINSNAVPGNYIFSFDPTTAISATNEARNVLTTAANGTLVVSIAPTSTPTPTASPTNSPTNSPTTSPTNAPGQPNSCGGTCGSNSNCQSNLICYQGYCRNPSCSWDVSCSCVSGTVTPSPTIHPTASPTTYRAPAKTSTPKPTEEPATPPVYEYFDPTPAPTQNNYWENVYNEEPSATPIAEPSLQPIRLNESTGDTITPWIIGSLVIGGITLVLIAFGIYKHSGFLKKSKPPVIKI